MSSRSLLAAFLIAALCGCSTHYRPPVIAAGSVPFNGLADLLRGSPLDVVLVHGMCTHDSLWALAMIDNLARAIDARVVPPPQARPQPQPQALAQPAVEVVEREVAIGGGTVRFHALVWSSFTTPLKAQLDFDRTGEPSNCSIDQECRPRRARLNGMIKDGLLNNCLADVMAYQDRSHDAIVAAVAKALMRVAERGGDTKRPLVLVSESLGSKVMFDALTLMREPGALAAVDNDERLRMQSGARSLSQRLALAFMLANQLPMLALGEQDVTAAPPQPADALRRFLRERQAGAGGVPQRLQVVAFTDPNDPLSYRLLPSRYAGSGIELADVLVSNERTFAGLLERPDTAHTGYANNPDVVTLIACGQPRSPHCR